VEIDPDKLYPQLDYTDDVIPRARDTSEAMAEALRLFGAQDFVRAESVAREILAATPRLQEVRILLARALLGENKIDEAEKLFRAAQDEALPTAVTLAWANIGLGEIALRKGQAGEAAKRFNDAVRADAEYAASLLARAERIKAEATAPNSAPPVDESARAFLGQLDHSITNGTKAELDNRIVPGELVRFVGGIVGTKPEVWQTRVLRTEQLAENLLSADVNVNSKVLGKEQSGTAVLILARINGSWKLSGIELFEVR
jgi:tetratricopeptide (TPR) repeat protein